MLYCQKFPFSQLQRFKYLGVYSLQHLTDRQLKQNDTFQKVYKLQWVHNNKKCFSTDAKLRHHKTVIFPKAAYASETMVIVGHFKTREIEKERKKHLGNIYGAIDTICICMKEPDLILKNTNTITEEISGR